MSEPAEPLPEPAAAPFIPVGPSLPGPVLPRSAVPGRVGPGAWAPAPGLPTPVRATGGADPAGAASPARTADPAGAAGRPDAAPFAAASPALPHSDRRPSGRVVSGRGVTGRGIVVLILVVTGVVGLIEVALAGHRGHVFGLAFVVSSAVGALVVRRRDLATAMIAPPLLYCVLVVAMSAVDRNNETGGLLTREGLYVGNAFVTGAPAVWAGTVAAALIAGYRYRASAARTPRTPRVPHSSPPPSAGPPA